ncbi:MAG: prepilin-type N-terminal cleavage/methylation domain-containing protein [Candidatus Parcubacteria bacterium]|nr:prepilin-type N-terminal cleavage/methylation domain-containing protein [Candidatus Parcubacteria bacterium]
MQKQKGFTLIELLIVLGIIIIIGVIVFVMIDPFK